MATTTHPTTAPLSHDIRRVLSKLRWRIRFYVWLEGFLAIAVWVGLTFWLGLALDYLPVLMWANELPWGARAFGLGMVGAVSLWLVFRYILRRTFVPLRDRSMAVVLERRYGDLGDSLVTSVELSQRPTEADVEMLQNTNDVAAEGIRGVRIGEVFHFPPLVMKAAASVILLAPIGAFYAAAPDKFDVWVNRFYRLQEQSWPRNAHISVVGAEVHRDWSDHWSQRQPQQLRKFENGVLRVARGASMQLRVGADARAAVIPDYCTIVYRSSDRSRGRVNMQQVGSPRDGQQLYTFDAKPLKGVLNDIRFDVVGFDHRVRNYRIEVVESPAVVSTLLHCTYPKYLEDEETGAWTPRSVEYLSSGMQLPQGTEVRMEFRANKPITEAIVLRLEDNQVIEAEMLDDQSFQCRLKLDGQPLTLEVLLADHNNVLSEQPQRYLVGSVEDQPPKVNVRLRGIGSAVTPDVVIPIEGTIEDDYQVDRAWFDVRRDEDPSQIFNFPPAATGPTKTKLDFRLLRSEEGGLELEPGQQLELAVRASDRFDLDGQPHVGGADPWRLAVVTPDELLAILERAELALRRRFEQSVNETEDMRDELLRVQVELGGKTNEASDPSDAPADSDEVLQEQLARRLARIRQSASQSQKIAQEVLGVSISFIDIGTELTNNRLDTEDRKDRLEDQIASPLKQIAQQLFPELDEQIAQLEKSHNSPEGPAAAETAVDQSNRILTEMNTVLDSMLNIESYNELIELVRELIKEQAELIEKTDKKHKSSFFDE